MTIGAFVAELIWWHNLEVVAYFKANNCYLSVLYNRNRKNYFIANYITEEYIFKKHMLLKIWIRMDRNSYITQLRKPYNR